MFGLRLRKEAAATADCHPVTCSVTLAYAKCSRIDKSLMQYTAQYSETHEISRLVHVSDSEVALYGASALMKYICQDYTFWILRLCYTVLRLHKFRIACMHKPGWLLVHSYYVVNGQYHISMCTGSSAGQYTINSVYIMMIPNQCRGTKMQDSS